MPKLAISRRHRMQGGIMSQSANEQDIARALRPPSPLPWVLLALVMVGAVGGAAWFNDQRGKTDAALHVAEQKAAATEAERANLAERMTALEAEKSTLENQKAELTSANESLARDVEEKVDELALLNGTANGLQEQLKEEIAKGDVRVAESGGKLRVDLVDKVLFDSGETEISKRGEGVLARVGAVLAQIDDKQIQVSGHTDNQRVVGEKLLAQFPTNWELSTARAVNVVRFLTEKAGVPAQRLVASGYADLHPVASNKTTVGRARNRRIEILLTPLLDPKRIALAKLP
jgi:chemotaxis protein MotB